RGSPARRAARSQIAMSTAAIACAIGPLSPDCSARTAVFEVRRRNASCGVSKVRPSTSGAIRLSTSLARCSAPTAGKLHHASPQPIAPSSSSTETSTIGRSRITPKDVTTGTSTGARYTRARTFRKRWSMRYCARMFRRILLILAPWGVIVLAWYAIHYSGLINPALVPAPHAVAARFWELAGQRLPKDVLMSTERVFVGVVLGILLAVPVGFVLGWYREVRAFTDPLLNFFRALPPIALIPLVIVYFGIGEGAKVVILFYASFFAGVIVMYEGIAQISPIYVRVARTLGAGDFEIFLKVIVPLTVPHILTALRVALGVAWATLVASELIAAQQGLGSMIQNAASFFQLDIIYVGIICIGLIALVMDLLLRAASKRLVAWQDRIA